MTPLISIIMPSYNRADMIGAAIRSVIDQSYTNIELIIVDDCSKDNSAEVIKGYASNDKRIKFIQNKQNKKLPATLNVGFAAASGEYLTWTSDDNLLKPDALRAMADILISKPEIGLVYTDYTTINEQGDEIARVYQEPPEYLPIRDCVGACFLYRADIARKVGSYNEDMFLIEDYEFFLRVGFETSLFHIPESHYLYRVHEGALTQRKRDAIKQIKNELKRRFAGKYQIPNHLKPIDDLYIWFIQDRTVISYIKLLAIILRNPIITMSYIWKNLRRMKKN